MAQRNFDVIVVLGAGLTPSGEPTQTLRRRVRRGVELLEESGAAALVLTGGPPGSRVTEAEAMRRLALEAGVAPERILIEPTARNTLENAERTALIMAEHGWISAAVVSDRMHLPRALLSFRAAGVRATAKSVKGARWRGPFRTTLNYLAYEIIGFAWYVALILAKRHSR